MRGGARWAATARAEAVPCQGTVSRAATVPPPRPSSAGRSVSRATIVKERPPRPGPRTVEPTQLFSSWWLRGERRGVNRAGLGNIGEGLGWDFL